MELEILKAIQLVSNPVLDVLALVVTMFGQDIVLIGFISFVYWNVDKKKGAFLCYSLLASLCINTGIKNICRFSRPIGQPGIISKAVETAGGYSFPSGHSQSSGSFLFSSALLVRRRWFTASATLLACLVGLSRLYLGVHYPKDVLAGLLLAAVISWVAFRIYFKAKNPEYLFFYTALVMLPFLFFGMGSDFFKALALLLGFGVGVLFEMGYVGFSESAPLSRKILRWILGLALLAVVRASTRHLFGMNFLSDFVCYFCVAVTASGIWPFLFSRIKAFK